MLDSENQSLIVTAWTEAARRIEQAALESIYEVKERLLASVPPAKQVQTQTMQLSEDQQLAISKALNTGRDLLINNSIGGSMFSVMLREIDIAIEIIGAPKPTISDLCGDEECFWCGSRVGDGGEVDEGKIISCLSCRLTRLKLNEVRDNG